MAKKKTNPDFNACVGNHDNFGMIYVGMLKHEAFKKLTAGEKLFYVYCRVHAMSERSRQRLYTHGATYNREYNYKTDFVFTNSMQKEYGLDPGNSSGYFHSLAEKGFIEIKENNARQKICNVYSFCDKWK